jgi:hypothetical protein
VLLEVEAGVHVQRREPRCPACRAR